MRVLTAIKTMQTTTIIMIMRHAALRPDCRWYSAAVTSSLSASLVSASTEEMFDAMLSRDRSSYEDLRHVKG